MAANRGVWVSGSALCMALSGCGSGQAFADGAAGHSAQASGATSRGGAAAKPASSAGEHAGGQPSSEGLGGADTLAESGGNPSEVSWTLGAPKGGEGSGDGGKASWGAGGIAEPGAQGGSLEGGSGSGGDATSSSGGSSRGGESSSGGRAPEGGTSSLGGDTGAGGRGLGGAAQGGAAQGGAAQGGAPQGGHANGSAGNPAAGAGGALAAPCGVFINEVRVGSNEAAADEFVELYNSCGRPISLAGFRLTYRAAGGNNDVLLYAFGASDALASKSFLVLGGAGYVGTALGRWGGGSNGVLSALAGGVALSVDGAAVVDALAYGNASNAFVEGSPALTPTLGTSIGRVPDGLDTNDNWHDFAATTSTPGAPNH